MTSFLTKTNIKFIVIDKKTLQLQGFFYCQNLFVWFWLSVYHLQKTKPKMTNLLYIIAVILIIAWALGAFVYSAGSIIHVLLVIAIIAIILGVIRRA